VWISSENPVTVVLPSLDAPFGLWQLADRNCLCSLWHIHTLCESAKGNQNALSDWQTAAQARCLLAGVYTGFNFCNTLCWGHPGLSWPDLFPFMAKLTGAAETSASLTLCLWHSWVFWGLKGFNLIKGQELPLGSLHKLQFRGNSARVSSSWRAVPLWEHWAEQGAAPFTSAGFAVSGAAYTARQNQAVLSKSNPQKQRSALSRKLHR